MIEVISILAVLILILVAFVSKGNEMKDTHSADTKRYEARIEEYGVLIEELNAKLEKAKCDLKDSHEHWVFASDLATEYKEEVERLRGLNEEKQEIIYDKNNELECKDIEIQQCVTYFRELEAKNKDLTRKLQTSYDRIEDLTCKLEVAREENERHLEENLELQCSLGEKENIDYLISSGYFGTFTTDEDY